MNQEENILRQELKDAINKFLTFHEQQIKDLNQDDRTLWVKVYGRLFGIICDLVYREERFCNNNRAYSEQRIATLIVQEIRAHFPDLAIVFGRHAIDKQQWIK